MPSTPIVMTFPGKVRIIDNGPIDDKTGRRPAVTCRVVPDPRFAGMDPAKIHARMRNQVVTRVEVPSGFHLEYEHKHTMAKGLGHRPEKPLALVKVVSDAALPAPSLAMHAELEHVHEESAEEIVHVGTTLHAETEITESGGLLTKVERIKNMVAVQTRKLTKVIARSTIHPDVAGEGQDAAAAVADLHAKLEAHLAPKPTEEKPEDKPEDKPEPPKLATIHGDEGTGEGSEGTGEGSGLV